MTFEAGAVTLSQQWLDRAGPPPANVDGALRAQMMEQLEAAADGFVINHLYDGGRSTGAATWSRVCSGRTSARPRRASVARLG